ncbi:B3 domain-containing protein REM8-like [Vicia villosa]|uniref:B3 domain-containing protein REM8-like n=1 Tax=Vicia villosa TaxID=3911 RepID=UPI00273B1533|nr:B3 domain-containing protein REM8-like [Vicia villosa]
MHSHLSSSRAKESKHFMKAILLLPVHSKQIRIPDEFISRFGNELNNVITLTVPDGCQWNIQLNKCHNNEVFLTNKWQEFSQHYSLHYGYYLDFNYQGNSNFNVVIYDTTSLEISYPITTSTTTTNTASNEYNPKNPSFRSKSFSNQYAYISSDFASKYLKLNVPIKLQNSRGNQWQVSCRKHTVNSSAMRISAGFCKFAKENNLSEGVTYVFELIKKVPVLVLLVTQLHKAPRGRHGRSAKEKHFKKAILPSPLHEKQIRIPNEFVTRFGKELGDVAEISVPDGSVWEMKLEKRNENIFLSTKWQEFAEYYSIEYGCYMSFKYEGDSKFSVVIFDATSVEICYPLKTSCTSARKMSEVETSENHGKHVISMAAKHGFEGAEIAANEFNPENPFFRTKVYRDRYPYAPSHFAKKYLKPDVPIKLQNADGKQWEVCCAFNIAKFPGAMRILKGYFEFHSDNNLSEGDHCVFELIKLKPVVLKVTMFRAVDFAE